MNNNYSKQVNIITFKDMHQEKLQREVIEEIAVLLMVNGEDWLTLRCSPVDLEEMGVGFLFNLGIINKFSEIKELKLCERNILDIWLDHSANKPVFYERTSGCTAGALFKSENLNLEPVETFSVFSNSQIYNLLKKFLSEQDKIRNEVRGLHSSALSDGENIILLSSDIGRHNTLDKLAGFWLKTIPHPSARIFLCTGRISSEMLLKCARMRSQIILSLSTPTAQAVMDAEKLGITLIGYARSNSFSVYSFPQRIRKF